MLENNQNQNLVLIKDLGMQYPTQKSNVKTRFGLYKCVCGNEFKAIVYNVKKERTSSCGCSINIRNGKHGYKKHRLYKTWHNMLNRCTNIKDKAYINYGERGITICERWLDVANFIEDMYPTYKEGLTIDRKENDKGYYKDNCRWVDRTIQARNTRLLRNDNKSGFRGVSWDTRLKKWLSYITVNKKHIHLGLFTNAKEAALIRDKYVIDNKLEHTLNFY